MMGRSAVKRAARQAKRPDPIKRLPLRDVGLNNIVAVPYVLSLSEPIHTTLRLGMKEVEILPAKHGFSNSYTVNGVTATAFEFMYGKTPSQLFSQAINA